MSKRVSLVCAGILATSLAFTGCNNTTNSNQNQPPTPAPNMFQAPSQAAPQANVPSAEPVRQPGAPDAMLPPPTQAPTQIPREAQAAIDDLLGVLSAIADTAKKESCTEILSSLKALNNDETKKRLLNTNILHTYPEEVQIRLNDANQPRLLAVAFEMSAFQKCGTAPEREAIDATIKDILSVVDGRANNINTPAMPSAPAIAAPTPSYPPPAPAVPAQAQAPAIPTDAQVIQIPAPAAPAVPAENPAPAVPADNPAPAAPAVPAENPAPTAPAVPAENPAPAAPAVPAENPAPAAPEASADDPTPAAPAIPAENPAPDAPAEG